MDANDLEQVLGWRNHAEVRRYMFDPRLIPLDEHCRWFEKASKDPARHLLVYEQHAVPAGFINIHPVASGGIAEWGFYAAPGSPKGTGRSLGRTALRYAFEKVGLHKVCGRVLDFNERSLRLHLMLGFVQEGILRDQHFDGLHHHDVMCLGLLANEWHPED